MPAQNLVGKSHTFPDGDKIEIFQVKPRGEGEYWITVHMHQGPGIPRKLVFSYADFVENYGHLFGVANPD